MGTFIANTLILCVSLVLIRPAVGQLYLSGTPQIKQALDKLNVLGSVLMIAAHPDDENTAVLAYCARGRKLRTGYLSCTRGEGGQNLIGSEQGDLLGVIRTQELLAARGVDGAEQYFTRAIDFGFSKTAEETLQKWGHDKVLSDIVWVIRQYQPDVIVARFSGTPRDGHGQHQASALLAKEAFVASADRHKFPEQLRYVQPWQAKRLMWNAFAFTPEQEREVAQLPKRIEIDTGVYDPVLGKSYAEIAAISRTEHKSQGMGTPERRGPSKNYFTLVAGEPASTDLFDGIDTSWDRVPGGRHIGDILKRAADQFIPEHPEKTIPLLLQARPAIAGLASDKNPWAVRKLGELDEAVALCAGLRLDADADRFAATPGSNWKVNLTAIDRSPFPVTEISAIVNGKNVGFGSGFQDNIPISRSVEISLPADEGYSQPFWLRKPHTSSTYEIDNQELIGRAAPIPVLTAQFQVRIGDARIMLTRPVRFHYVDRVQGELVRPLVIAPPVAINLPEPVLVFTDSSPRKLIVRLNANVPQVSGVLRVEQTNNAANKAWKASPESREFKLDAAGDQQDVTFEVAPPDGFAAANGPWSFRAIATVNGKEIESGMQVISYSHIPPQTVFEPSDGWLRPISMKVLAKNVGYVMGAGDEVPNAIRQMGCQVTLLETDDLARGDLSVFDAIVTGVRAYNVRADLKANQQRLLDYVHNGGTLIVQYNVAEDRRFTQAQISNLDKIGPFPLTIGRDRVTVEEAPVVLSDPSSPLLNTPNRIVPADFEGWVQERGLYFASKWDPQYNTVLETHDPGEKPLPGGMLYARYGKGVYIFTAYSWFRQLPAGVPGAYRLFANLLSAGKALQQK